MSSTLRTPPPTVSGTNTVEAVRRTTSSMVERPSGVAEMSRKTISSAPSAAYRAASSTGSPSSVRPTKLTPFTTLPAATSRQGITRLRSIGGLRALGCEVGEHPQPHRPAPLGVELHPRRTAPTGPRPRRGRRTRRWPPPSTGSSATPA